MLGQLVPLLQFRRLLPKYKLVALLLIRLWFVDVIPTTLTMQCRMSADWEFWMRKKEVVGYFKMSSRNQTGGTERRTKRVACLGADIRTLDFGIQGSFIHVFFICYLFDCAWPFCSHIHCLHWLQKKSDFTERGKCTKTCTT